ncbi:GMC oxidoreductase [Atractiella rhizophila]|nr:GMC oxidoreductase [Atractiella rhizophila]
MTHLTPPQEADLVVAGCGTAACIFISRLAKANPDLSIVAIEAGPPNIDLEDVRFPAHLLRNLAPTSKIAKHVFTQPMEELNGRTTFTSWGHGIGGSSQINFMAYSRGNKGDFDAWGKEAKGWDYESLSPYLRKSENHYLHGKEEVHGYDGPLHVSYVDPAPVAKEWMDAGVGLGMQYKEDVMDFSSVNAVGPFAKWINATGGHRSLLAANTVFAIHPNVYDSTTEATLRPDATVHIIPNARVNKVLLSEDATPVAKGLEYVKDDGTTGVVQAKKLVILSAGALNSPLILERSGIGRKEVLEHAGVKQRVELSVGEDLQDHSLLYQYYHLSDEVVTNDPFVWAQPDAVAAARLSYQKDYRGPLATTAIDGVAKIRPPSLSDFGSVEFEKAFKEHFEALPDKVTNVLMGGGSFMGDPTGVEFGKYFSMHTFLAHPLSRGHIHITAADIDAPQNYRAPFLTNKLDLYPIIWAYKRGREQIRRMPSYRGELAAHQPDFSATSKVKAQKYDNWDPTTISDLEYSEEDDRAIEKWARDRVCTTWHTIATTPMKYKESGGVVDASLSVYGVKNLKVADLGIAPSNVSANTYHTSLTIGEKAAAIIAKELGFDL